jgi:hypothetical protein
MPIKNSIMWKHKMIVKDMHVYFWEQSHLNYIVHTFSIQYVAFDTIFPAGDAYNGMLNLAIISLEWSQKLINVILLVMIFHNLDTLVSHETGF